MSSCKTRFDAKLETFGRGSNGHVVRLGDFSIWFSYQTPVAFGDSGSAPIVRENEWGPTTGAHLAAIDGGKKDTRIDGAEFLSRLESTLSTLVNRP